MTDFDRLERLVRIRDSGGLTEDEFQAEKAKLLATAQPDTIEAPPPAAHNRWLLGGGIATALVLLLAIMVEQHRPAAASKSAMDDNRVVPAIDNNAVAGASNAAAVSTPTATPADGSYAWATSIFRMGENPAYIEKILGPSKQKDRNSLFYSLQGCPVTYLTKGSKVTGIQMGVSDNCTPEVKGNVVTPRTNFGAVYSDFGFLQTSCLMLCGNKADPTIEYVVPGPHSDNFIGVSYSTYYDDGADIWGEEIAKANGVASAFDVPSDAFYCPAKPSQAVIDAMKNAKVQSVTIGVKVDECAQW
ncbi:MAG: SHOCT domain-containing protein [Novosphingobium sp.]